MFVFYHFCLQKKHFTEIEAPKRKLRAESRSNRKDTEFIFKIKAETRINCHLSVAFGACCLCVDVKNLIRGFLITEGNDNGCDKTDCKCR